MLYINQRKYPDMPYQHNLKHGGAPADKSNISSAGCGLCCLCMVVENMTMHSFSLEECRQMVYDLKANMSAGSDLQIMGPAVAEKFGLTYDQTDDINKMLAHVHAGGMAVANSRRRPGRLRGRLYPRRALHPGGFRRRNTGLHP